MATYRHSLEDFCAFFAWELEDFDPKDLDTTDVKTWLLSSLEKGKSARTVKKDMAAVHSLYRFLLRIGKAHVDITRKVVLPKADKPLPVVVQPEQMDRLEASLALDEDTEEGRRDSLIIELLYQTGIRQAELLGLRDSDVDYGRHEIRVFGKRKKERVIPIGAGLEEQIRAYQAERGPAESLFLQKGRHGAMVPLARVTLYNIVHTRMTGIVEQRKSPHVLRHTFATAMLRNGADIRTIQTLLGHASVATTQVYTHLTQEQVRDVYRQTHPRSRGAKSEKKEDEGRK